MNPFTEEEIRSNLIVPLLKDIGFAYAELSLETSFSIQLGRGIYDYKNTERKFISGRLDILCSADKKNIFLIELKAEDVPIDKEQDLYQALSYARLLPDMPPYVLLTNGKESYIYETVSGKEVDNKRLKNKGFSFSIDEEILFRYNALRYFVGYSYENLLFFCKHFNAERLEAFVAGGNEPTNAQLDKKYIPATYVNRERVKEQFNDFLSQTEKNVFAIIGESGAGKTNEIINLVMSYEKAFPCLFYSGTTLGRSIFKELQLDFNLEFSSQETALGLLKRLKSLTEKHSTSFLIFIDAIDEWIAEDKLSQLNDFIKAAAHNNIKICISCKDVLWNDFLVSKGIPTYLSSKIFPYCKLETLDTNEQKELIGRYSNFLAIDVSSNNISPEYSNPFSLRLAFEVSFREKRTLDLTEFSSAIIKSYITQKIIKGGNEAVNHRYLNAVAKVLLQRNKVIIEEQVLRELINLSLQEDLPIELFINNLLFRTNIDNVNFIGFYFSIIRDHIICCEILNIPHESHAERQTRIQSTIGSYIGENAILYYFRNAPIQEKFQCLNIVADADKSRGTAIFTKFLAQQEPQFYASITKDFIEQILTHIEYIISNYNKAWNNEDEIKQILKNISNFYDLEQPIINFLKILDKSKSVPDISPELCKILRTSTSKSATNELVKILTDEDFDDRVRRFVIDALDPRNFDKAATLNQLLNELIKGKTDVFFYAKHWYRQIENVQLRDRLLFLFDSGNENIKDNVLMALMNSTLPDTGELAYQRFISNTYSVHISCWLCRVICSVEYKPAIPRFIEIFEEQPDSELAGHILIGLGELKARTFIPILLQKIKTLENNYKNGIWLPHAFTGIANADDYAKLYQLANSSTNINTIIFAAEILSIIRNQDYDIFVLYCLKNLAIAEKTRYHIFYAWATNLTSHGENSGYRTIAYIKQNADSLTGDIFTILYELFEKKDSISVIAFLTLINFEKDLSFLFNKSKSILPGLKHTVPLNQISLVNEENLVSLRTFINPWLRSTLLQRTWSNPYFAFNCLQLARIMGDATILESIEANKIILLETLDKIENEKSPAYFIENILHQIRVNANQLILRQH